MKKRVSKALMRRIEDNKQQVAIFKRRHGCARCGVISPDILDCHHKRGQMKRFAISSGYAREWADIEEELSRCEVLCSNCHRIEHRQTRNAHAAFRKTGVLPCVPRKMVRRRRPSTQTAVP